MSTEYVEHPTLVIRSKVKETIPSQYPIEFTFELEQPHVRYQPFLIWKTFSTQ